MLYLNTSIQAYIQKLEEDSSTSRHRLVCTSLLPLSSYLVRFASSDESELDDILLKASKHPEGSNGTFDRSLSCAHQSKEVSWY